MNPHLRHAHTAAFDHVGQTPWTWLGRQHVRLTRLFWPVVVGHIIYFVLPDPNPSTARDVVLALVTVFLVAEMAARRAVRHPDVARYQAAVLVAAALLEAGNNHDHVDTVMATLPDDVDDLHRWTTATASQPHPSGG